MWAAGCCLYRFVFGKALFCQCQDDSDLLEACCFLYGGYKAARWPKENMYRRLEQFDFPGDTSQFGDDPVVKELLLGLLNPDPSKRLTAQQALDCVYFDDV